MSRPYLLWSLYLLAVTLIALGAKALFPELRSGPQGLGLVQLVGQALLTLLPLPLVMAFGWRPAGFQPPHGARSLVFAVFPALTVAVGYLGGFREMSPGYLATAVALVVMVAVAEEALFRGVLLGALLPRGVGHAVVASSALFGLTHLANLALGSPWQSVLLQVLFAGLGGAGFAAVRLRTGSIWPAIVLHALYDLAFRVGNLEPFSTLSNAYFLLHGVGWALFAVLVLRQWPRRASAAA